MIVWRSKRDNAKRTKNMAKNLLVVSVSPRNGGNSDLLCDQFILGAKEAGNEAKPSHHIQQAEEDEGVDHEHKRSQQ